MACLSTMDLLSVSFFLALTLILPPCSSADVIKGGYHYYDSGLNPASINARPFTHLYYAFAKLDPSTYAVLPEDNDGGRIAAFTPAVRRSNPDIQTMLSIGGGNSPPSTFSSMASNPTARANFIRTSIALARRYGFDGLDLDWEYPSTAADMANFGILIQEWQAATAAEIRTQDQLLLTAAVYFTCNYYTGNTYPVPSINDNLDWVNIMAYDFWSWQRTKTGVHTALYKSDNTQPEVSADGGVLQWLSAGLPPEKAMLGLASYGLTWYLQTATSNGIGAAATEPGPIYSYDAVQSFIKSGGVTCRRDSTVTVAVYCYGAVGSQTLWVGYDDATSISAKVNYLKGKHMGGYFFWRLDFDANGVLAAQASATMDNELIQPSDLSNNLSGSFEEID